MNDLRQERGDGAVIATRGATVLISHEIGSGREMVYVVMPRYTRLARGWLFR
jgi:hypothetical protein